VLRLEGDPAPTRSRAPLPTDLLVYDDDCGLCTAAARWLDRHSRRPLQIVPMSTLPIAGVLEGLDAVAMASSAHYVTPEGREFHGGESITRALRLVRGGELAGLFDLPMLRVVRAGLFRLVARNRNGISRLLGLRCRLPETVPAKPGR
jgi:predicted DCC family thiol-disulfide oxidoreductase YuxK